MRKKKKFLTTEEVADVLKDRDLVGDGDLVKLKIFPNEKGIKWCVQKGYLKGQKINTKMNVYKVEDVLDYWEKYQEFAILDEDMVPISSRLCAADYEIMCRLVEEVREKHYKFTNSDVVTNVLSYFLRQWSTGNIDLKKRLEFMYGPDRLKKKLGKTSEEKRENDRSIQRVPYPERGSISELFCRDQTMEAQDSQDHGLSKGSKQMDLFA